MTVMACIIITDGAAVPMVIRFGSGPRPILDEVGDIHWHFLDLGVVERFNVLQRTTVVYRHEVDRNALATKSSATTNPVNAIH